MHDTTTMMIEHIINGFHFLITLILASFLFMGLLGYNAIDLLQTIFLSNFRIDFFFVNLFLFMPFIYTLGILIDNFVDNIFFKKKEKIIRNSILKKGESGRELIMRSRDDNQAKQLDYIRTKIRIARTATFSYTIIIILLPIVTLFHGMAYLPVVKIISIIVMEYCLGAILIFLAHYSWETSTKTFCNRIKNGFIMLENYQKVN